jgi:hypothetical protein
MSSTMVTLGDLFRADVRTSKEADEVNTKLQVGLGFDFRYQSARIALGLSLGDKTLPDPCPDLLGKPIRGETLFGLDEADLALWAALLIEHDPEAGASRRAFVERAGAHWHRGARRLWRAWSRHNGRPEDFLVDLMGSEQAQRKVEASATSA